MCRSGADDAGELCLDVVHEIGIGLQVGAVYAAHSRIGGKDLLRRLRADEAGEQIVEVGQ